jgi:hypothetical protein
MRDFSGAAATSQSRTRTGTCHNVVSAAYMAMAPVDLTGNVQLS